MIVPTGYITFFAGDSPFHQSNAFAFEEKLGTVAFVAVSLILFAANSLVSLASKSFTGRLLALL